MDSRLTPRQKCAADYYLETKDMKGAAEKAGYKTLSIFDNENVKNYIRFFESRQVAGERDILNYLTQVLNNEDENISHRIKAAELLGKRYGTFTETKKEVQGAIIIKDDITESDENE